MSDFRKALQDPERYATVGPIPGPPQDTTERTRAALPTARTEMPLRPTLSSSHPQYVDGLGASPSIFRDSLGEVWVRKDVPKPILHRGRGALLVGLALAVFAVGAVKLRGRARAFLAMATAPSHPSSAQVTFTSDPDRATVVRTDGTVLGVTPFPMDIPYGDQPIEYVVRLKGYISTTTTIIPNHSSPVLAVLRKEPIAPLPLAKPEPPITPGIVRAVGASEEPAPRRVSITKLARHRAAPKAAAFQRPVDGDDTLEPSME